MNLTTAPASARATPVQFRFRDDTELMSKGELRAWQWRQLATYLQGLSRTNPYYADLWRSRGVDVSRITSVEAFTNELPITRKPDFLADQEAQPPFGNRLGVSRAQLNGIHITSGTTGIGQEAYGLTAQDQRICGETFATCWDRAGVAPGDTIILTAPVTFLAAGLGAVYSTQVGQYTPIYGFGLDKRLLLDLARRYGAVMLYAPPTLLLQLKQTAQEIGLDPRKELSSLRGIVTSLFAPPFSIVHEAAEFWGVPVFDAYGSTQAGGIAASSCECSVWNGSGRTPTHFNEKRYFCEVLNPQTGEHVAHGEEGELVITPLWREASPVIRFGTSDRVTYTDATDCPCKRPYAGIVPGLTGRYDDMLKIKGTNVWPAMVDSIVFDHPAVAEYRATVTVTDRSREELILTIDFKQTCELDQEDKRLVLKALEDQVKAKTLVRPRMEEAKTAFDKFDFKPQRWADERDKDRDRTTW